LLTLIRQKFMDKGLLFTDSGFRLMMIEKYYQLHAIDTEFGRAVAIRDFTASKELVYEFKKRNRISSRRAHSKRKLKSDSRKTLEWKREIDSIFQLVPRENSVNFDGTSWKLCPNGILTWAET
jgi:hypothetical protein